MSPYGGARKKPRSWGGVDVASDNRQDSNHPRLARAPRRGLRGPGPQVLPTTSASRAVRWNPVIAFFPRPDSCGASVTAAPVLTWRRGRATPALLGGSAMEISGADDPGRVSMLDVNEYFDGKVKSIGFQTETLRATVGVMAPGNYEFATTEKETVTVVSGALTCEASGLRELGALRGGHELRGRCTAEVPPAGRGRHGLPLYLRVGTRPGATPFRLPFVSAVRCPIEQHGGNAARGDGAPRRAREA